MTKSTYKADLKAWKKRRPKSDNNYRLEAWLEEKPDRRVHADGTARKRCKS